MTGLRVGMSLTLWTPRVRQEHFPLLERLRAAGFDGVEIPLLDASDEEVAALRRALDGLGLGRTAFSAATPEANPISADAAIRAAAVERFGRLAEQADRLGATVVTGPLHAAPGAFSGEPASTEERARCMGVLLEAAEHGRRSGVAFALEPLNRFESHFLNTVADTHAIVEAVGSPHVRTALDTHHAHLEEADTATALWACADSLGHVQVSENHRGGIGSGQVDWPRIFAMLKEIRYQGWLVVECHSRHDPEHGTGLRVWREPASDLDAVCAESLAFVRAQLASSDA